MTSNDICEIKGTRNDVIQEVTEKMLSDETYEDIASLFKLLGDYNRIRIINALEQTDELCVCELSLLLDMSQSSISHQLRILRAHNIVKARKENKRVFYCIKEDKFCKLIEESAEFR